MDEQRYVSGYAGRIQNDFSDFICSEVEKIDGDELWACLSLIIMQEGGAMNGVKWMSVGNDRMVEMFSLHSIYYYVLSKLVYERVRANEVSD